MNNHKYLTELGIDIADTPYGWNEPDDSRLKDWKKQQNTYGFDERETWSLDATFIYWLYERVKMFNEVNIVDTEFHKFNINGKELTQQQCINRIIELCKTYFKKGINEDIAFECVEETLDIWKAIIFQMWW